MIHPLLRLLLTQPALLADHAAGYAELFGQELGVASRAWRKKIWLSALGACCGIVAVMLAGVAIMLWAAGLLAQNGQAWVLVATPLVPALAALGCWLALRSPGHKVPFDTMVSQVKVDLALVRRTCTL